MKGTEFPQIVLGEKIPRGEKKRVVKMNALERIASFKFYGMASAFLLTNRFNK